MDEIDPRPDDATTLEPVEPPPERRGRWIVAGLVVAAAIAGTIAAFLILGTKPLPEAYRYLPADSAVVLEFRPEWPGDQRQHLGNFLARFPGFADQSSFSDKIDQVLSRLVGQATDGQVDYWTQIKPLLAGPMVAGVTADAVAHMADGGAATLGGRTGAGVEPRGSGRPARGPAGPGSRSPTWTEPGSPAPSGSSFRS